MNPVVADIFFVCLGEAQGKLLLSDNTLWFLWDFWVKALTPVVAEIFGFLVFRGKLKGNCYFLTAPFGFFGIFSFP